MTTGERLLGLSYLASGTTLQHFMAISGGTSLNYPELTYIDITDVSVVGASDGELEITASGGTPSYEYSIGGAYQVSNVFTGLTEGIYDISVKDYAGLTDSIGGIKLSSPSSPSAITPYIYNLLITDITQTGLINGTIKVFASGGTPTYTYSLNGDPYQVSNYFTELGEGVYSVSVKDANGIVGTLSGIKVGSAVVSGGGFGRARRNEDNVRYRAKVNVKNVKLSDNDINESKVIKVNVII